MKKQKHRKKATSEKKRRIRTALIIAGAVLALVILILTVGNILGDIADETFNKKPSEPAVSDVLPGAAG